MILYVLGPSCAGKSTWVAQQRKENDIVFDFDAVASTLGGSTSHNHTGAIKDVTFAARDAIETKVQQGVEADAYIIRSNLDAKQVQDLAAAGALFAVIDPGKDVALARAAKERPEWAPKRIEEWYENPPVIPDEYLYKLERSMNLTGPDGIAHRMAGQVVESAEEGTFIARAISYTETYETPYFLERFEPGCVQAPDAVPILRDHDTTALTGKVTRATEGKDGRYIEARLTSTALGTETRTLLVDGTLSGVSVGFKPIEWREEEGDGDRPLIIHERIEVIEYSLTAFPAYKTAEVTSARSATPSKEKFMETITRNEFEEFTGEVTGQLTDLIRRAEAGEFTAPAAEDDRPTWQVRAENFETMGEWVKAVAAEAHPRHDEAMALHRDLTTADIPSKMPTTPGWIGDLTRKITERRRWTNLFDQKPLPAKGMTVDYIKTTAKATVEEQLNQLDPLAKGSGFTVTPGTAPVRTFGGAETVSQQVIDRSESWVINDLMQAFSIQYARQTEAATKTYIVGEIDKVLQRHEAAQDAQHALVVPTEFGAFDWIDAVVDSSGIFEERGYTIEGLALSPDIFKRLAREAGLDGRPLLTLSGSGVNVVGQLNLPKGSGELLNVPVHVLHGSQGRALFYDPIAIRTMESSGAPFRLQDQNVLNLSQDFSVYGYMTHVTPYPDALLPIKFSA